jgi:hypothetical protein
MLWAGLEAGHAQRRVIAPLTLLLDTIKPGGFCQISRHRGKTGGVDHINIAQAPAIIASSGMPDPLGVKITRMWGTPMARHAAPQTTA